MRNLGAVLLPVLLHPALASGSPEEAAPSHLPQMPLVTVRADPLPDPLGPLPLATTVIGRDAIDRRPGGDLAALLEPAAGVRLARRGGNGTPALPSIRGSTFEQVLVLVDGRRRNPAQGGGVDLSGLPLESVETVEIARGGASALWGSDAIGGAIHVRTRTPEAGALSLRVGGGSFGERTLTASGAIAVAPAWTARASGRGFTTNGNYPYVDDARGTTGTVENGDVSEAAGDLRIDGRGGPVSIRLDGAVSRGERGIPGSEEFPTPSARVEDRQASAGLRLARAEAGRWQPSVDLSWLGRERDYREPEAAFGPVHDSHENRRAEAMAGIDRVGDHSVLRVAAGASIDRLDSTTDGSRRRRAGHARARASLDGHLGSGKWRMTGAARVDRIEGFAPFLSPRLAADLALGPRVALRGSAGLSYRAPSFDELFWPPRATAAGNPDLRAETGADADLGITLAGLPLRGRVSVDGFVRRVDDLIQWTPGASGIWRPHNIGRAALAGLEAELDGRIPLPAGLALDVVASGTFLRSEDRTGEPNVDGRELPYRPRFAGALSAILPALGGEFETVWRAVGDAFVTRANTKALPGHVRGDLLWRRPFPGGLRLDAGVTNLTDTQARDFRDYPLPGRAVVAGITWERTLR